MMANCRASNIAAVYDARQQRQHRLYRDGCLGGALADRMRAGIELADAVSVIVQSWRARIRAQPASCIAT
jgi:hypothetical protein